MITRVVLTGLSVLSACIGTYGVILAWQVAGPAQSVGTLLLSIIGIPFFSASPWVLYLERMRFGYPTLQIAGFELGPDLIGKLLSVTTSALFFCVLLFGVQSLASMSQFASSAK
jgi:hypothetical protein